jgi:hypothetical protein
MFLAVINESTILQVADLQKAVAACASQIKLHVAPIWDMVPASIVYYSDKKDVPPGADLLVALDQSDQAGAMGYHRETPDGLPYGRVFVQPILNHGGEPLQGSLSVSADLSHEVCEWFVDRFLNLWADGPDGQYSVEICDAVENDSYEIDGVSVSNFVTKRYFDRYSPPGTKFDYLNKLTKPFTMTAQGYVQVRKSDGTVHETWGERYPPWKKESKQFAAARSYKRLHGWGGRRSPKAK